MSSRNEVSHSKFTSVFLRRKEFGWKDQIGQVLEGEANSA